MNPITFSTLACPNWPVQTIIRRAAEYGYDGIEWRGGPQGHVRPGMSATEKLAVRQACSDAGLISLAVTAYTSFTSDNPNERKVNVDKLRRYADLAAELDAGYVRTFLGELPEGTNIDSSVYEIISGCLHTAAQHASSVGVILAVEPHDDFVRSSDVVPVLHRVQSLEALRVIWDIGNAYAAGEKPAEGFGLLKDHLAYVQVKDGRGRGSSWGLCRLGEGDLPLNQAFNLLVTDDYRGAFSVEWEYAWHPELDPPETALPAALKTVRRLLAAAQPESV